MADEPRRRGNPLLMMIIVVLAILVPFYAWYGSWWGRPLTDEQVIERLSGEADAPEIQHALKEVARRLEEGSADPTRFRDLVIALADHPEPNVRRMVAFVLGHDPDEACHRTLVRLLSDEDLATRRNAALWLSKWRDPRARPILLEMLEPLEVRAPGEGVLDMKVRKGDAVSIGRDMAVIDQGDDRTISLRPPMNGQVLEVVHDDGDRVSRGAVICRLTPDPESVYEALRALMLVGRKEDAAAVEPFAAGRVEGMSPEVSRQARLTLDHLRSL